MNAYFSNNHVAVRLSFILVCFTGDSAAMDSICLYKAPHPQTTSGLGRNPGAKEATSQLFNSTITKRVFGNLCNYCSDCSGSG